MTAQHTKIWRRTVAGALLTVGLALAAHAGPAPHDVAKSARPSVKSGQSTFITIPPVKGESTTGGHAQEIEIL